MEEPETIYINNAGLVLCNPYIAPFFKKLELTRGNKFVSVHALAKGVQYLQFLVNGNEHAAENELTLNKILCGLGSSSPLEAVGPMQESEKETAMSLLNALITNWEVIRTSSVAALRETFLQREGKLTMTDHGWKLHVQRKTVDVLVDKVPWSFSVIKQPWMDSPLLVSW